jgi:hypothetical protein
MIEPDLILEASKQFYRKKAIRLLLLSMLCLSVLLISFIWISNTHANFQKMHMSDLKQLVSAIGILLAGVFISFLFTIFSLIRIWQNRASKAVSVSMKEEVDRISSEIESGKTELDGIRIEKDNNRTQTQDEDDEDDEDDEHHSFIQRNGYQSMAEKAGQIRVGPRL